MLFRSNMSLSLPTAEGDVRYQAVFKDQDNVGGNYHPTTNKIHIKTNTSGTYMVRQNEMDFSDIESKTLEMQEAIKILASKGILEGKTATTFEPDTLLSRAEVASMLVRAVYQYDKNADGGYIDVTPADWFFGVAGSAKNYGIIEGYVDNTFRGSLDSKKAE